MPKDTKENQLLPRQKKNHITGFNYHRDTKAQIKIASPIREEFLKKAYALRDEMESEYAKKGIK